jgi:hypothetical protein
LGAPSGHDSSSGVSGDARRRRESDNGREFVRESGGEALDVGVRGSRGPVGSTCRGNGGRAPVGHPRGRNGPIFLSPYPAAPAGVGTCARALGRRGSSGTSMATPSPRGRSVDRWRIRWDAESRLPVATGPKRRRGPGSGAADVSALRRERLPAPGCEKSPFAAADSYRVVAIAVLVAVLVAGAPRARRGQLAASSAIALRFSWSA